MASGRPIIWRPKSHFPRSSRERILQMSSHDCERASLAVSLCTRRLGSSEGGPRPIALPKASMSRSESSPGLIIALFSAERASGTAGGCGVSSFRMSSRGHTLLRSDRQKHPTIRTKGDPLLANNHLGSTPRTKCWPRVRESGRASLPATVWSPGLLNGKSAVRRDRGCSSTRSGRARCHRHARRAECLCP